MRGLHRLIRPSAGVSSLDAEILSAPTRPKPYVKSRPGGPKSIAPSGKRLDGGVAGAQIGRRNGLRQEPCDDRRRKRCPPHGRILAGAVGRHHVGTRCRKHHLLAACRLDEDAAMLVHGGDADDARIRCRIKRRCRGPIISNRGDQQISARRQGAHDCGQRGVVRSHQAHVDYRDALLRQPGKSGRERIDGPAGRHVTIDIRRIQLSADQHPVKAGFTTYEQGGNRGAVCARHYSVRASPRDE